MAIKRRLRVSMEDLFPHGAFLTGDVVPVRDFDRSTREQFVQMVDKDTGLPLWEATGHDPDPEARKNDRQFTMKFATTHQPVPPETLPGLPFRPVEFEGLEVTPYLDSNGPRPKIAFSLRATGMRAPTPGVHGGQPPQARQPKNGEAA